MRSMVDTLVDINTPDKAAEAVVRRWAAKRLNARFGEIIDPGEIALKQWRMNMVAVTYPESSPGPLELWFGVETSSLLFQLLGCEEVT